MRIALALITATCLALTACGGSDDAMPSPTTAPSASSVFETYPGAVVGTSRTVNGQPYVTESGTGTYYTILGAPEGLVLSRVMFVVGEVKLIPGVHVIQASSVVSVPEDGSVACNGTLAKRDGRYFVEGAGDGGCGSVELIEGDPGKLDAKVGQATALTVRACTVTKEGKMVKADLDPDFACGTPPPIP